MKTGQKGINLIKEFEGFKAAPYLCPAGVWTIGFGTTLGVTRAHPIITESQGTQFLERDVTKFENTVNSLVTVPLTQDQFDALVCFTYNIGPGNFKKSTLLKLLNVKDYEGAAKQFVRWNRAGGREIAGLTRRRVAERDLFLG